jgi:DNA-binding HxlR family transcriptional regulator
MGRRQITARAVERATGAPERRDSRARRMGAELAPELDAVIHERMRLGIVSALAVNNVLSFAELKKLLNTTDGNLSVHARKLEEADYIGCKKFFEGRVPRTEYNLTSKGRHALEQYLGEMEQLIKGTRKG